MMKSATPARLFSTTALSLGLLLATAGAAHAALNLEAEVNPDPVQPGEVIDVQISVSSSSTTGNLSLRVLWPAELSFSPVTTGGGSCPGSCDTGEFLVWNLGALGPGGRLLVGFNENVDATEDGTFSLQIELLEGGSLTETLVVPVEIQADSPLELTVDPLSDPVASGGTLVYEIRYGNTGPSTADNAELSLPIPAGTQFSSATGGGVPSGGAVNWSFGNLAPNSGGSQRVTLSVDAVADGTLLVVDAAQLSADVNFQPRTSRAMAVSRVDAETLELAVEVNPDPVADGEVLDAQISISNPTASVTGDLTLRVLWPAELSFSPVATGGGDCPGSCDTGEYLFWDLGSLGPGTSVTVSFNENTDSGLADGRLVPLEIELFEGGTPARTVSRTLLLAADSPLEVFVDPLTDPVAAGGTLTYEVSYGNPGSASAENAVLSLPIPAGTQFRSATGGGVLAGDTVTWDLGSLPPESGGRQRLTVEVGSLADGTLLVVDSAELSGDLNFLFRSSRAMAVSRVEDSPLELAMEANPDPVGSGEVLDTQITVSNPTTAVSGNLTLRVLWPAELSFSPVATGGGGCPGSCDTGEYLFWDLGPLGPGVSQTVSFNENADSGLVDGRLLPLEVELFEGSLPARNVSRTVLVQTDSPLEIFVDPSTDPVASGGTLVYEVVYGNAGSATAENAVLSLAIPAATQFRSATGGGVSSGGTVTWNLGSFPPNTGGRQRVEVEVDPLVDGTLLTVDSATLSGEINFQSRESRASAVSRVDAASLELTSTVSPNPVADGELLNTQITIDNPTGSVSGNLSLRVLWPAELSFSPVVVGGGSCPGSCDTGEYLFWDLGPLGPGASTAVSFNEDTDSGLVDGRLIPLEIELFEGTLPARTRSHTVLIGPFVDSDMDGEADVLDDDDDDDGMPDWWERANGLDPLDPADAGEDADGDGRTNLEEYLAGTDPNASDAALGLTDLAGLILPGFDVEVGDAGGPTTFLSVRNTSSATVPVRVDYFADSVAGDPVRSDDFLLAAEQTLPINVRQNLAGLPVEDGIAQGLAIVTEGGAAASPDLEGDYYRVDFGDDFAAGDRLVKVGDLCAAQEVGFVDFGSGTELRLLLDRPIGDAGPSFSYVAYSQAGAMVASGGYFTDQNLLVLDISDLVASESFGAILFDFRASRSGWVSARYSAFGRFSLELNGVCVDPPASRPPATGSSALRERWRGGRDGGPELP